MIAHASREADEDHQLPDMLITFRVGREWFGIDVLRVQEVMPRMPCTPVPRAPAHVIGLINVRGSILTNISVRRRLGFAVSASNESMNIIVTDHDAPLALAVDEIGDVIACKGLTPGDTPAGTSLQAREQITGVLRLESRLITLLAIDRLCAV